MFYTTSELLKKIIFLTLPLLTLSVVRANPSYIKQHVRNLKFERIV